MGKTPKYVLDANVFIEAKRRYYAFDLCPGFWEALVWHHSQGRVLSIDRVGGELRKGNDDLREWATSTIQASFFESSDETEIANHFAAMVAWVQAEGQFKVEAKAEFAAGVDGWLIAFAKAKKKVLVTQEILDPQSRKKVPIPNICSAFGVEYVNTFQMLKALNVRFTWKQ